MGISPPNIVQFMFYPTGRRKQLFKENTENDSWISINREAIKNMFSQHVKDTEIKHRSLNHTTMHWLKSNFRDRRKRDGHFLSRYQCELDFEQLLKNEIVYKAILSSSILWQNLNKKIAHMTVYPPVLNIDETLKTVLKELELLGPWSILIGKYSTHWIKNMI